MELTENMEEFLNDLIGKRMEQVYQENDGEQYDSCLLYTSILETKKHGKTDFIAETPQGCTNIPCGRNKERRVF